LREEELKPIIFLHPVKRNEKKPTHHHPVFQHFLLIQLDKKGNCSKI